MLECRSLHELSHSFFEAPEIMKETPDGAVRAECFQIQEQCPTSEITTVTLKGQSAIQSKPKSFVPLSRKRVTFNERAHVRETINRSEYTTSEIMSTWCSQIDRKAIKADISADIYFFRGGTTADDDFHCLRGIETLCFRRFAMSRKENKLLGLKAVLDEQDRQEILRINDPEAIRQKYCGAAGDRSTVQALKRGKADEMMVNRSIRPRDTFCDEETSFSMLERMRGIASEIPLE